MTIRYSNKFTFLLFCLVLPGSPSLMDAPSSLTCEGGSNMAVTLQWTPPTNTGGQGVVITHYNITGLPQRAICSPGPCDMVDGTATTITGLQCNTSYSVAVRAVNCRGIGNSSNLIAITVQPAPIVCAHVQLLVSTAGATGKCIIISNTDLIKCTTIIWFDRDNPTHSITTTIMSGSPSTAGV